jgi:hypothetical protein
MKGEREEEREEGFWAAGTVCVAVVDRTQSMESLLTGGILRERHSA